MADLRFRVDERSSGSVEGDIVDRNGAPVPAAQLTSATLTLIDLDIGANPSGSPRPGIINGRNAQNVLNANQVTIDAQGHFIWSFEPDDSDVPDTLTDGQVLYLQRRQVWRHKALFVFLWATGEFRKQIELDVVNLHAQP
jgi:hypothetical protein